MIHFQCPRDVSELDELAKTNFIVFLAGGITGCDDWQLKVVNRLQDVKGLVLVNPRREFFDKDKISIKEQIEWEYEAIKKSKEIAFWFTPPTLNPITLFEYGKCLVNKEKAVLVGIHPDYARREDVIIQTELYINEFSRGHNWKPIETLEHFCEAINLGVFQHHGWISGISFPTLETECNEKVIINK
jgi:hypothetical protein